MGKNENNNLRDFSRVGVGMLSGAGDVPNVHFMFFHRYETRIKDLGDFI